MERGFAQTNPSLKKNKELNPFLLVIFSFMLVILVGTIFLLMPFSQTTPHFDTWSNFWNNLVDCFFLSVSATCVTGLCTFSNGIANQLTLAGQIAVLVMIQIGGLGFITVLSFLLTIFNRKISFKNRNFLSQAVGSTSFGNVVSFVRKIILVSFSVELIGTGLLIPVFMQTEDANISNIIWRSIFHSVSAFNNAGFDILGNTSLLRESGTIVASLPGWAYVYMNVVIMTLIILGGISFLVIFDVFSGKRPHSWRAFTKVALTMAAILLVGGTLLFVGFECFKSTNPMNVMEAIFQSVTCRTAGFAIYDQENLSVGGRIVSCVLMFIGASPLGTAGGVKTTTLFMVVISLASFITGRDVHAFKRTYSNQSIIKAMVLLAVAVTVVIICYCGIAGIESGRAIYEDKDASSILLFECFSAFGTVGLSQNWTPNLLWGSKLIITLLMFVGRLGPMTLFQVLQTNLNKKSTKSFSYVEEDFLIG